MEEAAKKSYYSITLCTRSLFSSHLSLRSPAALLFETLLLRVLVLVIFNQCPKGVYSARFFILSCTLCSLSLFFCSSAVGFGWSWMVSTKPIDLCRVCAVNPVNFTWHNYKRPAQELTRDCVLLRCLTTAHVYQSTSRYSLNTPKCSHYSWTS